LARAYSYPYFQSEDDVEPTMCNAQLDDCFLSANGDLCSCSYVGCELNSKVVVPGG
jgi:hypothetical protein